MFRCCFCKKTKQLFSSTKEPGQKSLCSLTRVHRSFEKEVKTAEQPEERRKRRHQFSERPSSTSVLMALPPAFLSWSSGVAHHLVIRPALSTRKSGWEHHAATKHRSRLSLRGFLVWFKFIVTFKKKKKEKKRYQLCGNKSSTHKRRKALKSAQIHEWINLSQFFIHPLI